MQRRDLAARVIGLLVFALGIGILVFSFYTAYHQVFSSPTAGIKVVQPAAKGVPATAALSQSALSVFIRLGALLIMVLAGSLIASRGVQMYFASSTSEDLNASSSREPAARRRAPKEASGS